MSHSPTQEHSFDFQGIRTWSAAQGRAEAPPIVLITGGPGFSSRMLSPLFALADQYRVIAYDQLGCGASADPPDGSFYAVEPFRQQLLAVLDAYQLERSVLLGHSWGAMLALLTALTAPERVTALILIGPMVGWKPLQALRRRFRAHVREDLRPVLDPETIHRRAGDPSFQALWSEFDQLYGCRVRPWPDYLAETMRNVNGKTNAAFWGHGDTEPKNWDLTAKLVEIRSPTLVLTGRYDAYAPFQDEVFRARMPHAQVVECAESAHCPWIEEQYLLPGDDQTVPVRGRSVNIIFRLR